MWTPDYFPESCPAASFYQIKISGKDGKPDIKMYWMDGGIRPNVPMNWGPMKFLVTGMEAVAY